MASQTENMEFDVCSVPMDKDILEAFPILKRIKAFNEFKTLGLLTKDCVIRYIIILYSRDSFLQKDIFIDYNDKKLIAAKLSGFHKERNFDGEVGKYRDAIVKKLFSLEDKAVVSCIMEYLRFQDTDGGFAMLYAIREQFWQNLEKMAQAITTRKDKNGRSVNTTEKAIIDAQEVKRKLKEECFRIREDIKKLQDELYPSQETKEELINAEKECLIDNQ